MVDELTLSFEMKEKITKGKEIFFSQNFIRYKIITKNTPPRYYLPFPFIPKIKKIGLATYLIKETLEYNFKLIKSEYRKLLLSSPCIYGVFGGRFGGFNHKTELCTGCMRCVLEFPNFCTVKRNNEYTNFTDSYWTPKDPNKISISPFTTVWYEAETGKIPIRGMGYKLSFTGSGWDSIWTDMSEIVRPSRDGVYGREYISTAVNIGRKHKYLHFPIRFKYPNLEIPIPLIFDYRPESLDNISIRKSVSLASNKLQTLFISDPKIQPFGTIKDNMIPLITEDNFKDCTELISKASCIEFVDNRSNLYERIKLLNPNSPLIARLAFNETVEARAIELANQGVSGLHLYANYHGLEYDTITPRFIKDALQSVHKTLINHKLRDQITIIVSGGIILAEHIPKAIICGADLVAIDTSVLVALQVKFEGECKSAETGKIISDEFDYEWGAQRLVNLVGSWYNQLIEILSAMGIRDVRRLCGDTGRALLQEELEEETFGNVTRID